MCVLQTQQDNLIFDGINGDSLFHFSDIIRSIMAENQLSDFQTKKVLRVFNILYGKCSERERERENNEIICCFKLSGLRQLSFCGARIGSVSPTYR